jgi:hypothetical protein
VSDHVLSGPPPHFFRRCPKLGSFCTFHSPAEPRPTRGLSLPTYPSPSKFGFVSHFLPPAHASGRRKIGFVLDPSPVCSNAVRRSFAACPSRPRSGGPQEAHASQCPDGRTASGTRLASFRMDRRISPRNKEPRFPGQGRHAQSPTRAWSPPPTRAVTLLIDV